VGVLAVLVLLLQNRAALGIVLASIEAGEDLLVGRAQAAVVLVVAGLSGRLLSRQAGLDGAGLPVMSVFVLILRFSRKGQA
jgi:hypothetical protein